MRTELEEQIERERAEAANGGGGAGSAGASGDDEARKAKDRERKRAERAAKGGASKPRRSSSGSGESKPPEIQLDPRVVRAVNACLASMTMDEITDEFAKEMGEALQGALSYELEVRLPLLASGYEPEIGLSCAIAGAGVTRFRLKRAKGRARKPATVVRDVTTDPAPGGEGEAGAGGPSA